MNKPVTFKFTSNGATFTCWADDLEEAILEYRRQIRRRAKKDRADRGSFTYTIDGGNNWLK